MEVFWAWKQGDQIYTFDQNYPGNSVVGELFSMKGQIVSDLDFVGHVVSFSIVAWKEAIENT